MIILNLSSGLGIYSRRSITNKMMEALARNSSEKPCPTYSTAHTFSPISPLAL
jgi:hypothetical protein